jgi:hypothetical protein
MLAPGGIPGGPDRLQPLEKLAELSVAQPRLRWVDRTRQKLVALGAGAEVEQRLGDLERGIEAGRRKMRVKSPDEATLPFSSELTL